jgi:hypothetical protein
LLSANAGRKNAERHTRFISTHAPHCTLLFRVPPEDESSGIEAQVHPTP